MYDISLVEDKLRLVHSCSKKFVGRGIEYDDLYQAGCLGLIKAAEIIEDGRIDKFVANKYISFNDGIGMKIVSGEATLEELAAYAEKLGAPEKPISGSQEFLHGIVNNILFK